MGRPDCVGSKNRRFPDRVAGVPVGEMSDRGGANRSSAGVRCGNNVLSGNFLSDTHLVKVCYIRKTERPKV